MGSLYEVSFIDMGIKLATFENGIVKNVDFIPTEIGAYRYNDIYDSSGIYGERIGYVEFDRIYVNYRCVGRIQGEYILSKDDIKVARFEGDSLGAAAAAVALGLLGTYHTVNPTKKEETNHYSSETSSGNYNNPGGGSSCGLIIYIAVIILFLLLFLKEGINDIPQMIGDSFEDKQIDPDLVSLTLLICIPMLFLLPIGYAGKDKYDSKDFGDWLEHYLSGVIICGIVFLIFGIFFFCDGILDILAMILGLILLAPMLMIIPSTLTFFISRCSFKVVSIIWILILIITIFMTVFGLIPMKKQQQDSSEETAVYVNQVTQTQL